MRNLLAPLLISILVLGFASFALVTVNVPLDGLKSSVPRPLALAKFKYRGCGLSTMTKAGVTRSYNGLDPKDAAFRSLNDELLRDGYSKSEIASGCIYRKRLGGLMPITAVVYASNKGSVSCSAIRSKWFWQE